jgi:tRNA(Ile)-lysidine synthase
MAIPASEMLITSDWINKQTHRHFCIAFSGGIDSQALLYNLYQLRELNPEIKLDAVHIHHGVNAAADNWLEFCREQCKKLNIVFKNIHITLDHDTKDGFEAQARQQRYQALWKACPPNAALVTAHHADDQAETMLFRLFRGAGLRGLSAMQKENNNSGRPLLRPLLNISRQEIEAYARANNLLWVEDPSNKNIDLSRNYIRHEIIPKIKHRWPNAAKNMEQAAEHLQNAQLILDFYLEQELKNICTSKKQINIRELEKFSPEHQALLLRLWIRQQQLTAPTTKQLAQVLQMIHSKEDAQPQLSWGENIIRRFNQKIGIYQALPKIDLEEISWDGKNTLVLPQKVGEINFSLAAGGLKPPNKDEQIFIRWKIPGFKFRIAGHKHHKDYKNLMQDFHIPPWERDRVPLIYFNDTCVAIANYAIADTHKQNSLEVGLHVNWLDRAF